MVFVSLVCFNLYLSAQWGTGQTFTHPQSFATHWIIKVHQLKKVTQTLEIYALDVPPTKLNFKPARKYRINPLALKDKFLDAQLIRSGLWSVTYENSSPSCPEEVVVHAPSSPPCRLASPNSCSKFFHLYFKEKKESSVLSRKHVPGAHGASSPPANLNYKPEELIQLKPLCFSDRVRLFISLGFHDLQEWRRLTTGGADSKGWPFRGVETGQFSEMQLQWQRACGYGNWRGSWRRQEKFRMSQPAFIKTDIREKDTNVLSLYGHCQTGCGLTLAQSRQLACFLLQLLSCYCGCQHLFCVSRD